MKPTTMTVRPGAGRRFTAARLVTDADGNAHVVIEEEDAPPTLPTPEVRARNALASRPVTMSLHETVAMAITTDRDDTWEKACKLPRHIAVHGQGPIDEWGPGRVRRGDWNCIALEDLEKLLKGTP